MNTKPKAQFYSRTFASLGGLTLLVGVIGACDVEENNTAAAVDEVELGEVEFEELDVVEPDEVELGDESLALVSESPDQIDGLSPVGFDEERQVYVYDRDDDGYPDITEELEGTDIFDPDSYPGFESLAPEPEAGFPSSSCRPGFRHAGPNLCISKHTQNATRWRYATTKCRNKHSNVCSYEDLTYLYYNSSLDASYNPSGKWIGNMTADDRVLCGNRTISYNNDPDWTNFEKECHKNDIRSYWCCHDDDV